MDDRKLQAVARERERNAVVTSGRAATAVGHVKNSLMLRMDTFTNVKVEAERKKREEENRKRLEAIQKMYLKKTEDDAYNNDYVLPVCYRKPHFHSFFPCSGHGSN